MRHQMEYTLSCEKICKDLNKFQPAPAEFLRASRDVLDRGQNFFLQGKKGALDPAAETAQPIFSH